MGHTNAKIGAYYPHDELKSLDLELLVDTGSTYAWIGRKRLEKIEYRIKVVSPFIEDIQAQGVVLYDRDETFEGIRRRVLEASRSIP